MDSPMEQIECDCKTDDSEEVQQTKRQELIEASALPMCSSDSNMLPSFASALPFSGSVAPDAPVEQDMYFLVDEILRWVALPGDLVDGLDCVKKIKELLEKLDSLLKKFGYILPVCFEVYSKLVKYLRNLRARYKDEYRRNEDVCIMRLIVSLIYEKVQESKTWKELVLFMDHDDTHYADIAASKDASKLFKLLCTYFQNKIRDFLKRDYKFEPDIVVKIKYISAALKSNPDLVSDFRDRRNLLKFSRKACMNESLLWLTRFFHEMDVSKLKDNDMQLKLEQCIDQLKSALLECEELATKEFVKFYLNKLKDEMRSRSDTSHGSALALYSNLLQ